MKNIITAVAITVFSLAPFVSNAQFNFPVTEIQKLTNKNVSDFDTYVMEKEYSMDNKASTQILKVYHSDKPAADGKQYTITRYQVPNMACKIEFTTTDKKYYLDIKSKLESMGFKLMSDQVKTINGSQAQVYNYSNGPFVLVLSNYKTDVTWYVVEIHAS